MSIQQDGHDESEQHQPPTLLAEQEGAGESDEENREREPLADGYRRRTINADVSADRSGPSSAPEDEEAKRDW